MQEVYVEVLQGSMVRKSWGKTMKGMWMDRLLLVAPGALSAGALPRDCGTCLSDPTEGWRSWGIYAPTTRLLIGREHELLALQLPLGGPSVWQPEKPPGRDTQEAISAHRKVPAVTSSWAGDMDSTSTVSAMSLCLILTIFRDQQLLYFIGKEIDKQEVKELVEKVVFLYEGRARYCIPSPPHDPI